MKEITDPQTVLEILQPMLEWDLSSWKGLPRITVEILSTALGDPVKKEESMLGWHPAINYVYETKHPSGGLGAYVRTNNVVLVEVLNPPPLAAMKSLDGPTIIKPHEILDKRGYVHEYLYGDRGLILSILEPFDKSQPMQIIRCRGIKIINSPEEFGPEFYQAFEDKMSW